MASRRRSRQTGRTREQKGRQAAGRNEAFLTILAIREFGLPSGSLAQVLSWCGGRCETEGGGSRSGGRGRNLCSVLVCLGCAETVTCWGECKGKGQGAEIMYQERLPVYDDPGHKLRLSDLYLATRLKKKEPKHSPTFVHFFILPFPFVFFEMERSGCFKS